MQALFVEEAKRYGVLPLDGIPTAAAPSILNRAFSTGRQGHD